MLLLQALCKVHVVTASHFSLVTGALMHMSAPVSTKPLLLFIVYVYPFLQSPCTCLNRIGPPPRSHHTLYVAVDSETLKLNFYFGLCVCLCVYHLCYSYWIMTYLKMM